jgi:uncharacterized protein
VSKDFVAPKDGGALVRLRVSPGAKSTELQGRYGETALKLKVSAPPVDGRANAEVERFLADLVGTAPSSVRVVRGHSARDKTVFVGGIGAERVREVLSSRRR